MRSGLVSRGRATTRSGMTWLCAPCMLTAAVLLFGGCQWYVDDADHEVYRLIDKRQRQALGETRGSRLDRERSPIKVGDNAYQFAPHPVDSQVPASFTQAASRPAPVAAMPAGHEPKGLLEALSGEVPQPLALTTRPAGEAPISTRPAQVEGVTTQPGEAPQITTQPALGIEQTFAPASQPAGEQPARPVLKLAQALQYSFKHSRPFQSAKEDLYLAALALTLERHLWSLLPINEIRSQYVNYGEIHDFDQAMDAVAEAGVKQRLPYGGEVTAKVISTLMRDLGRHVTTGESGQVLLDARIPLLKGAGPAAYESRYQAERNLIYAVRAFEHFRRSLAVDIAGDYFELQVLRQAIFNAHESVRAFSDEVAKAYALWRAGRVVPLEVQRARQNQLVLMNGELDATEAYQTALDNFKIRIGMPTETAIDVEYPTESSPEPGAQPGSLLAASSLEEALQMPAVDEEDSTKVAMKYRLDLLNDLDRIDDSRRGVAVAENGLLPNLQAWGTVQMDTDPNELGMLEYGTDRATWRGGLTLELPLDRKAERNALRAAQISQRRSERQYGESRDLVRFQVRRAMRRVEQARTSLSIQTNNRDLALRRRVHARFLFNKGKATNFEVAEAEKALLDARNRLAQAQTQLFLAVLQFRRDTGTLRIDDDGSWLSPTTAPAN